MIKKIKDIFYMFTHIEEIKRKLQSLDEFKVILSKHLDIFTQIEKLLYNNCEIRLFYDNNKINGMFQDSNSCIENKTIQSDSFRDILYQLGNQNFDIFSEDYQAKALMEDMIEIDVNGNIIKNNKYNYVMPDDIKKCVLKDIKEELQRLNSF